MFKFKFHETPTHCSSINLMKLIAASMTMWTLLGRLSKSFVADLLLSAFDTDTP